MFLVQITFELYLGDIENYFDRLLNLQKPQAEVLNSASKEESLIVHP